VPTLNEHETCLLYTIRAENPGVDSQTYTDSNQNTQGKRISLAKLFMFRESRGSFESNPAFVLHLRSQTKAYLRT
jgi:hypothetical protein